MSVSSKFLRRLAQTGGAWSILAILRMKESPRNRFENDARSLHYNILDRFSIAAHIYFVIHFSPLIA
jgi:hypothetical protein